MFFSGRDWETSLDQKIAELKYREILDENLLQSAQDLTDQQDNDPKHTMQECQDNTGMASGQISECP